MNTIKTIFLHVFLSFFIGLGLEKIIDMSSEMIWKLYLGLGIGTFIILLTMYMFAIFYKYPKDDIDKKFQSKIEMWLNESRKSFIGYLFLSTLSIITLWYIGYPFIGFGMIFFGWIFAIFNSIEFDKSSNLLLTLTESNSNNNI